MLTYTNPELTAFPECMHVWIDFVIEWCNIYIVKKIYFITLLRDYWQNHWKHAKAAFTCLTIRTFYLNFYFLQVFFQDCIPHSFSPSLFFAYCISHFHHGKEYLHSSLRVGGSIPIILYWNAFNIHYIF